MSLIHSGFHLFFNARKDISEEDIKEVSMPSAIPFVYKVRSSCSRAEHFVDSGYAIKALSHVVSLLI
jgi:hypothetical protein